jgi:hypothetical protein
MTDAELDALTARLRNGNGKWIDCNVVADCIAAADAITALRQERDLANDGWHMANGTAELAMKHRDLAEQERDNWATLATDANTGWAAALNERDAALALLRRIYARDLIGWSDPLSKDVYELLRRKP